MNRKHLTIRIFSVLLGLILGISAGYTAWYLKNSTVYEDPLTQEETEAFINSDLWDKIVYYIETESSITFITGYNSIYFGQKYADVIEGILAPYYEKYGTQAVITGALRSNQKLGIAYGIEKCCELIGEEKLDLGALAAELENVTIEENTDRQNYDSDYEYENNLAAIKFAKDRLSIAKSLAKEDYNNQLISKNSTGTRMAWIVNYMDYEQRIRVYDNKSYYTGLYLSTSPETSRPEFLSDDILTYNQGSNYGTDYNCVIYIHNGINEYMLSKELCSSPDWCENHVLMYSEIKGHTDHILEGEFTYYDGMENQSTFETRKGTYTLNLKNGDISLNT